VLRDRPELGDTGYETITPQFRIPLFYRVPPADPTFVVIDETLKSTQAVGQQATYGGAAEACGKLTCPTLVVNGRYDAFHYDPATEPDISPADRRARDAAPSNYTFAPLIDDMGHNLNQHPGAREVYRVIGDWIDGTLGAPSA
jgi:pimeloyl-ACP methyl ester carboxylesterase